MSPLFLRNRWLSTCRSGWLVLCCRLTTFWPVCGWTSHRPLPPSTPAPSRSWQSSEKVERGAVRSEEWKQTSCQRSSPSSWLWHHTHQHRHTYLVILHWIVDIFLPGRNNTTTPRDSSSLQLCTRQDVSHSSWVLTFSRRFDPLRYIDNIREKCTMDFNSTICTII